MTADLQIGDVAALTGISAGRIRHYEVRGLIAPGHRVSGYRTFSMDDVLRLLQIDLLRSLGMGLADIRAALSGRPSGLLEGLQWHHETLLDQRTRLDELIASVEEALAEAEATPAAMVERLARAQRDSLGVFGRLERPLSPAAVAEYDRLLAEWRLPIPGLFGQMVLPAPVSDLLERLAVTEGHEALFEGLRGLAEQVLELVLGDDQAPPGPKTGAEVLDTALFQRESALRAEAIGRSWVEQQLANPAGEPVAAVLREFAPRLADLPLLRRGFLLWAESMSPLAAQVLASVQAEGQRRRVTIIGAIVVPPPKR